MTHAPLSSPSYKERASIAVAAIGLAALFSAIPSGLGRPLIERILLGALALGAGWFAAQRIAARAADGAKGARAAERAGSFMAVALVASMLALGAARGTLHAWGSLHTNDKLPITLATALLASGLLGGLAGRASLVVLRPMMALEVGARGWVKRTAPAVAYLVLAVLVLAIAAR